MHYKYRLGRVVLTRTTAFMVNRNYLLIYGISSVCDRVRLSDGDKLRHLSGRERHVVIRRVSGKSLYKKIRVEF